MASLDIYRLWDGVSASLSVFPDGTTHKDVAARAEIYMAMHGARDWRTGACEAALEHLGSVSAGERFAGPGDRPSRLYVAGDRWAIAVEHDAVAGQSGVLLLLGTVGLFAEQSSSAGTLAEYVSETPSDSESILSCARCIQKHLAKN